MRIKYNIMHVATFDLIVGAVCQVKSESARMHQLTSLSCEHLRSGYLLLLL